MTHRAILWLQLQGKNNYLCQNPIIHVRTHNKRAPSSVSGPGGSVRMVKLVSPGTCRLHIWRVKTAQDGLNLNAGYPVTTRHLHVSLPLSKLGLKWSRTHLIQQKNDKHIPSHPLMHSPPQHFLLSLPGKRHQ